MIRLTLILAVTLSSAIGSAQQSGTSAHPQAVNAGSLGLQLTVSISNERFCSGDVDVYTDALDLATRYTNAGTNKLTLFPELTSRRPCWLPAPPKILEPQSMRPSLTAIRFLWRAADTCWARTRKV
jgi:hypothetical protein